MNRSLIIPLIALVVIILGIFLYRSIQHKALMDTTYSEPDLSSQEIIDAKKNLLDVSTNNIMNQTQKEVVITLPLGTFEKLEKGSVEMIRKDDITKNVQLTIEPNGYNRRTIPKSQLLKGMYKSRIKWWNDGKMFYKEESVFVE